MGNQPGRCTKLQCRVNVLHTGIKIKRCLIAKYTLFIKIQHRRKLVNIINDTSVMSHYPFWHPCRSGSKKHIKRICIQCCSSYLIQLFLVLSFLCQFLMQHNFSIKRKFLYTFQILLITDDNSCFRIFNNQFDASLRHLFIQWHIKTAAFDHSEKPFQCFRAFIHIDQNRLLLITFPN